MEWFLIIGCATDKNLRWVWLSSIFGEGVSYQNEKKMFDPFHVLRQKHRLILEIWEIVITLSISMYIHTYFIGTSARGFSESFLISLSQHFNKHFNNLIRNLNIFF